MSRSSLLHPLSAPLPRLLSSFAILILALSPALLAGAQTETPVPDAPPPLAPALNLPPIVSAVTLPRQIVYLDSTPSAGAPVMVDATQSEDPEGQPLEWSHDANGDGVFTPWFFRSEAQELVTMPGPFVVTACARDPLGAVGEQHIQMLARRFTRSGIGSATWADEAGFGTVGGRPAFVYEDGRGNLVLTANQTVDGSGAWTTEVVRGADVIGQWLGTREFKWGTTCLMSQGWWWNTLLCTFKPEKGGYSLRYLYSDGGSAGSWRDTEVVRVNGEPAATTGEIGYGPAILYHNSGALALLAINYVPGADDVRLESGFALLWSADVGAAPPTAHSAIVNVGEGLDLPAFAYLDAQKGQLLFAVNRQSDGRGTFDLIPVEGQNGDIGAPSLAVIRGKPAIAYRDGAKGHLKIAVNEQADGRGEWAITFVYAGTPDGPRSQSLAAVGGRAGIAFEDAGRRLLFAYEPGGPIGSSWPVAVVDHRLFPASRNPVLIDVDGRPAIGYGSGSINFATAR